MKRFIITMMVIAFCMGIFMLQAENQKETEKKIPTSGVCPPFYLKDEAGNIITLSIMSMRISHTPPSRPAAGKIVIITARLRKDSISPREREKESLNYSQSDTIGSVLRGIMAEHGVLQPLSIGSLLPRKTVMPG